MDLELRPITEDEHSAFDEAVATGFGDAAQMSDAGPMSMGVEQDRTLAVLDNGEIVATAGAFTFAMTVPGGAQVPTAGVTMVTVRPTHRRRGLLTAMMDRQLDDVAGIGEPLAALTASESLIYGRFGYGLATVRTTWELDTDFADFLTPADDDGRLRILGKSAAAAVVGPVYDAVARGRVGEVTRDAGWWLRVYDADRRGEWPSGTPKFFTVVHEDSAKRVDGFARYAIDQASTHGLAASILRVLEVQATDPAVEAVLWRYLFDVDLVQTVAVTDRPLDDPVRWRLVDPRRMRVTSTNDHVWLRIVDVHAAMTARTYGVEDALVIGLHDRFRPANSGSWLVEGARDGAACARTDREPDLVLDASDLGAIYLGGVDVTTLARAGRVEERTLGAVARGDRFFAQRPSPWCTTHF